jgi:hypothetical protein
MEFQNGKSEICDTLLQIFAAATQIFVKYGFRLNIYFNKVADKLYLTLPLFSKRKKEKYIAEMYVKNEGFH